MTEKKLSQFKGHIPFMLLIFLNAFVDLNHKILIADTLYKTVQNGQTLTSLLALLNALVLVPYIIFFTPTGFVADKFSKAKVMRATAAAAIPITLGITLCYYAGWFWPAYMGTLLLAIQSAFNSPAKYGYIKELYGKNHLTQANAVVQPLVIIAILSGSLIPTIFFQILVKGAHLSIVNTTTVLQAMAPLGWLMVILSCIETACTYAMPQYAPADPKAVFKVKDYFTAKYAKDYIVASYNNRPVFGSIIGLSIFMAVSNVMLATYPAYLKAHMEGVSVVFSQLPVALASFGILFGAWYAGRVSRGFIETGIIPLASILFSWCVYYVPMLNNKTSIIMMFITLGVFCGALLVPLNALIQFHASKKDLGKTLATNNLIQNIFMLSALILTAILPTMGVSLAHIFKLLFMLSLCASIFAIIMLPLSLIRYLIYFLCSVFFRLSANGTNNIPSTGGVLLLGNHLSYLDWAIIQIASPRPIRFVMERTIYEKWYFKIFLRFLGIIPITRHASKDALRAMTKALKNGEMVAIFPEGYLSRNGQLGPFLRGFERAATMTKSPIVPFYHRGLWGSFVSNATKHYQHMSRSRSRHVSITFGKAMASDSSAEEVRQAVQALSMNTWQDYAHSLPTIPTLWFSRAKRMGNELAIADSTGMSLSHHELISAALLMARKIKKLAPPGRQHNVGIMLPPSVAGTIVNLACWINGQTVVNLNYTTSAKNFEHAVDAAKIKTIFTATAFIEKLDRRGFKIPETKAKVIHLEDIKSSRDTLHLGRYLFLVKVLPTFILSTLFIKYRQLDETAAILFSSGSEGDPKGVELTHLNLITNAKQVSSVVNMEENDAILSALPLFHAFGLSVTMLMPLLEGLFFVCHPDPTDAVKIGKLISTHQITILAGTSSFFSLYCRQPKLHPLMFQSLRMAIAGAEKLDPSIERAFKEKFHTPIYEGYGTTEVSPVASVSLPDSINPADWHVHVGSKPGSVGLPLPGTAIRIVDPETNEDLPTGTAGMVLIGGPQVMKGYLNDPERTQSVLIKDKQITWYVTGDKGFVDEEGFLTLVDRYSRFAKIAGEMISLSQIERQIRACLENDGSEFVVAAAAIPHAKTGEAIGILYQDDLTPRQVQKRLLASDMPKIMLPKLIVQTEQMPLLGSGKMDYTAVKAMILAEMK